MKGGYFASMEALFTGVAVTVVEAAAASSFARRAAKQSASNQ
jgi:hypothetical protein